MKKKLFFLFMLGILLFTVFSYTVAKEQWQRLDFDSMVKLQDNLPRKFDGLFSYLSLLGSVEITIGFCFLLSLWSLLKRRWFAVLGWLMIIPATLAEVFGKLVVFHPGPPAFFHRSILPTGLPSFYVHTNFSYPSGHMTRTVFIAVVFACIVFFLLKKPAFKIFTLAALAFLVLMMGLTRVYLGEHWLSDVVGGALLGSALAFLAAILILKAQKV